MRDLHVVVAPSGYKESLDAEAVAEAIAEGVKRACPDARITCLPLVDGGEGTTRTLVGVTGGELREVRVTGPLGEPIDSVFGMFGGAEEKTAVLELAAAAGLRLVPRDRRDPMTTTSAGVGELIKAALDAGADRIVVGCGDSGVNDGGAGMARALGVRLLAKDGSDILPGGAGLAALDRIDLSGRDPRLADVVIDVACNIKNVLCGDMGVARVFGPQKGASPEVVEQLSATLDRYADIIERDLGIDVRVMPGGGASGGTGAGLHALLGANLIQRFDVVLRYLDLDGHLADADLVFTAEGGLDRQTPRGKIPAEVGRRARDLGVPVIALAGTLGDEVEVNHDHGIDAFFSTVHRPQTLEEAMDVADAELRQTAEEAMRAVLAGVGISERRAARAAVTGG